MPMRIVLPCEELHRLYIDEGLGMASIAALLGCSAATVSNRIRACGITVRPGRFQARPVPRALLEQLYSDEGLPIPIIATRLGVSIGTIHNRRRAYGIPARGRRQPAGGGRFNPGTDAEIA
ncbi:MAG: hypothetical protein HGA45_10180 [Chloroflexales bacterium]|nr:hypothetical protein [Chloroflexales bacterium]